jgi:hypothetical protein
MAGIPALPSFRKEDGGFSAHLGYIGKPPLRKTNISQQKTLSLPS